MEAEEAGGRVVITVEGPDFGLGSAGAALGPVGGQRTLVLSLRTAGSCAWKASLPTRGFGRRWRRNPNYGLTSGKRPEASRRAIARRTGVRQRAPMPRPNAHPAACLGRGTSRARWARPCRSAHRRPTGDRRDLGNEVPKAPGVLLQRPHNLAPRPTEVAYRPRRRSRRPMRRSCRSGPGRTYHRQRYRVAKRAGDLHPPMRPAKRRSRTTRGGCRRHRSKALRSR